jgi:hypothetical protein
MLRRRIVTLLCAALLLSLAAPGVALAEEPDVISSPTIVSAVVDTQTGVATVTVSVTCLMDVGYQVRGEASLSQPDGSGQFAFSSNGGFGGIPCQAGDVLTFPVRFSPFVGRFVPGPAEISGFLEAQVVGFFSDDTETIGPTTVVLAEKPDISSPTIVSAVVDTRTGVATVTVGVTCLTPAAVVRGEASLSQRYGSGHFAFSSQGFGGIPCQAGDVLTFPVRFPPGLDKFRRGPAEISGFLEAQVVGEEADDTETIGPTTVVLRPA